MTTAPKIALFGLFGNGNLGNGGSLDAMLRYLRSAHSEAEITCVCAGPEDVQREFGVRGYQLWSYRPVEGQPAWTLVPKAVGKAIDAFRTLRWVRRHDVVVVPGTGVLEATLPVRPWGFPYALLLVTAWGRLCGTKVALVSVGADHVTQPVTRLVMKHAARLAYYRSFRDRMSRAALHGMGVDTSNDMVYPDLAFSLPATEIPPGRTRTVGVGVMSYSGTYADRRHADEIYSAYVRRMTDFVGWLVDEGYRVRMFTGDRPDEVVAAEVIAGVRRSRPSLADDLILTDFAPSLSGLIEQMAAVDTVVATRFHNVLCALKLAKPTISISYAAKNDALMDSMGQGEHTQSIRALDVTRLIEQFRAIEEARDRVRDELLSRNETNAKLLTEQFALLSATLFASDGTPAPAAAEVDR
jgi:polysaccharide pyruvyl transferase WcaK-like protein